jgi:hypothetical protein
VGADEVASQLARLAGPHGAHDVVRALEREPEQMEPELGRALLARAHELLDQRLEGAARDDLDPEALRRRHRSVYEFSRTHSIIFE